MYSYVELTGLELSVDLGTYGPDDVVPDRHCLDLKLTIDASLVLIDRDGMDRVFDYDPLISEIQRLAGETHYETQEWLMSRIVVACAEYPEILGVDLVLRKTPVSKTSGTLGVRLVIEAEDFRSFRRTRDLKIAI